LRWLLVTSAIADEGVTLSSKIIGKLAVKKRNHVTPLFGWQGMEWCGNGLVMHCWRGLNHVEALKEANLQRTP